MEVGPVLAVIGSVLTIAGLPGFLVWYALWHARRKHTLRHQERMAMIEKGIYDPSKDPELAIRRVERGIRDPEKFLLAGFILGALGLAMLIPFVAGRWDIVAASFASFMPLLVAASLIGFYFVLRHKPVNLSSSSAPNKRSRQP